MPSSGPEAGAIEAAIESHPPAVARILGHLRSLIHDTAAQTEGVGALAESLKWGQPSLTPAKPRIGSSVRLGMTKQGRPALFFICHTHLVGRFREIYGDRLDFEGDRAILLDTNGPLPEAELKHCVAIALTYHRGQ